MLNSLLVAMEKTAGVYNIIMKLPEKEYFDIYGDIYNTAAEDIVAQYLTYNGYDGEFSNVDIEHNKNKHLITIHAKLHYDDDIDQNVISKHLED